jgi:hypothetical protein
MQFGQYAGAHPLATCGAECPCGTPKWEFMYKASLDGNVTPPSMPHPFESGGALKRWA